MFVLDTANLAYLFTFPFPLMPLMRIHVSDVCFLIFLASLLNEDCDVNRVCFVFYAV